MNCQYWQSKKSFCNINYIMNIKYCQQVHKMLTKKFLKTKNRSPNGNGSYLIMKTSNRCYQINIV